MNRAFCLVLITSACASQNPQLQSAAIDFSKLPKPEQHPDAPSILLLQEETVVFREVEGKPTAEQTTRTRTLVLRDDGRSSGSLAVYYNRTFEEITAAGCTITHRDGTVVERKRSDMVDQLAISGAVLYDDLRVLRLENVAPPGSVVECISIAIHKEPQLFSFSHHFGAQVPIAESRFELRAPADWELEHVTTRYWVEESWVPASSTGPAGEKILVWEKKDLAAFPEEPAAASDLDRIPRVTARLAAWTIGGKLAKPFKSLDDHARWLSDLSKGTAEPTAEIKRAVEAALKDVPDDPREKARRLYEWVQENIRYVAVEIGLGGWRPNAAKRVFENKYGDCKDKATLLKAMLAVAGIDSRLAVLYSHRGYPRRWLNPTVGNANHAILAIDLPGGTVIVDPTTRAVPFGELPLNDQEAELVMVKDEGAGVVTTPASTPDQNALAIVASLELGTGPRAKGRYQLEARGAQVSELRYEMLTGQEKQQKDAVERILRVKDGRITNAKCEQQRSGDLFLVKAAGDFEVDKALAGSGDARVFRLSDVLATPGRGFPEGERHTTVVFPARHKRVVELEVRLPKGTTISGVPAPVEIESELGRYALKWTKKEGALAISTSYELRQRIVPKAQYEALKKFFDAIIAAEATGIVLREESK